MEDQHFPDLRREGIMELVQHDYGKQPPYTDRYKQIALADPDWLVRASAVRALNIARDKSATPVFIKSLSDENADVRMEAAKALANIPDPAAIGPLLKTLNSPEENKDTRIAAANALKNYKSLEVARALTNALDSREFGLAWQARRSLRDITGKDFYYDQGQWLDYLTGSSKPLG
jgi:HEAT repeat protein